MKALEYIEYYKQRLLITSRRLEENNTKIEDAKNYKIEIGIENKIKESHKKNKPLTDNQVKKINADIKSCEEYVERLEKSKISLSNQKLLYENILSTESSITTNLNTYQTIVHSDYNIRNYKTITVAKDSEYAAYIEFHSNIKEIKKCLSVSPFKRYYVDDELDQHIENEIISNIHVEDFLTLLID